MTVDQVFGLGLIALGLCLILIVARQEKLYFGIGLMEAILKRLPRKGQRAYVIGLGVVMIVLGVIALLTRQ